MSRKPILEINRLTKNYAGLPAVQEVSFSIGPGEVLAYLGPNGSGKSTTVKMLAGLLEPTSGEILFRGRDIQEDVVGYKRRLGYVPEESNLYPFLSGWEYLELVGTLREMDPRKWADKAGALLQGFALYPHRHTAISSYSKGMRQRILLIAALMHDPEVLILDEPFSGLDVTMSLIFRQVVKMLAAQGKAIFFCSPVLEVVEKVCTHLVLLRRGSIVSYGPMDAVRNSALLPALEDTFLQLTDQGDAERTAHEILAAVAAPSR